MTIASQGSELGSGGTYSGAQPQHMRVASQQQGRDLNARSKWTSGYQTCQRGRSLLEERSSKENKLGAGIQLSSRTSVYHALLFTTVKRGGGGVINIID